MNIAEKYLRMDKMPHIWCPGCGNGIILGAFIRAIDQLGYRKEEVVVVSGIGCSSRASGYLDFNTLHTTHGRALAFATGIKVSKPDLKVFALMGDGDATAIGGNHFIHASRRNIDITAIVFNNSIYGMTGGQYSPLTPHGFRGTTAPYGNIEKPFDIPKLAKAAGATYVARATSYHAKMMTDLIVKGAQNKGFSVIEGITQCPVSFGRRNRMGSPADMLKWQKDNSITVKAAAKLPPEKVEGKFLIGEIYHSEAPEFTDQYAKLVEKFSIKRRER